MSQNPKVRKLETLLKQKFDDTLIILDQTDENLVPIGDNFSGNLLKISVRVQKTNGSKEELHFIGKGPVLTDEYIDWTIIFKKEIYMYIDIIKSFEFTEKKNSRDYQAKINNNFLNLCGYRLSLDPKKNKIDEDAIFLLENIKIQGYYVLDKKIGMDFVHAKEAIKALANFHAVGIATKNKYPLKFEEFIKQADTSGYNNDKAALKSLFENCLNAVKRLPCREKYVDRVEKLLAKRGEEGEKFDAVRNDLWSTITHNDFWTNNIMFHKDELTDSIDGLKIIDFQAYAFANLFIDIYYFMFTSLDDNAKNNNFDDLLEVYYNNFISSLRNLRVDVSVYSKNKFNYQLKKDAWYELFHCAFALSFFLCEVGNGDSNSHLENIFAFKGGDLFLKKLDDLLRIYDERGWLD